MARVTVEDCLEMVENRFALVLLAAQRTRQLVRGSEALVDSGDNKEVVTSLREIAAGLVKFVPEPEATDDPLLHGDGLEEFDL